MIEVMFGESEAGSMKVAKHYHKSDNYSAIGWIGEKPGKKELDKMLNKRTDGKAVGGNSSEVVCIPIMLDIGDISVPIDSEYRKELILELYTINGWNKITIKELVEVWNKYLGEIERLKNFASNGEEVRIWYSNAPYSMCGFYYVCNLLSKYNCKVSAVKLPHYMQLSENKMQFYTSWCEIDAGRFSEFLPFEKELSSCEMRSFSSEWEELKLEGSTLRAVVSGKVIGVPEDFYDHIIRKEIPDGEFLMAQLIGNAIGKHPLGIADCWYAKRINMMIDQGELVVVQKQKEIYRQILKKG
jgi:hypothetical protein